MSIVKVRRGNVILRVPSEQVNDYVNQGFDAYDENGKLVKRALLNDVTTLQKLLAQSEAKIAELQSEIDTLRAELAEVKAQSEEVKKKPATRKSAKA